MADFERFTYELQIKERHLDSYGHVNNAAYLELLEEARWEFITAGGFGLEAIHAAGLGPVVLELDIKFLREIKLRQIIRIESQLVNYDKKIGILRQDIFNDQAVRCCQARMTFGLFDLKARKLVMPTPKWLNVMGVKSGVDE